MEVALDVIMLSALPVQVNVAPIGVPIQSISPVGWALAPLKSALVRFALERFALERFASLRSAPERFAPERLAPERFA